MKRQFVDTIQEGDTVNDYFVATRKDLREKRDGGKFLGMVFKDRTGEIGGILWNEAAETAARFELGDVVNVRGKVITYQDRLQVRVEQVLPLAENEYSVDDLVAAAEDPKKNLEDFRALLETIQDPWLSKLVAAFLADEDFVSQFCGAAAGKKWHHAYRGGLLRHCYEMARIAETMSDLFPEIDHDLLLAGVFVHDIGKLTEMSHEMFVEYTTEGRMLGHLQIGCDMVSEKIRGIEGFPEKTRMELLHFILSHHGEPELGAATTPKTIEAVVLHHIDNLDAQAAAFSRIVEETRSQQRSWSDFQPLIKRMVWTKDD